MAKHGVIKYHVTERELELIERFIHDLRLGYEIVLHSDEQVDRRARKQKEAQGSMLQGAKGGSPNDP